MKQIDFIKKNVPLLLLAIFAFSTAGAQSDEDIEFVAQKKFYAPALSWVKSKLQPGEKIIQDTVLTYMKHEEQEITEFNYKTEKLNRTVYIFTKKGETNDILFGVTDMSSNRVDFPNNAAQNMQTDKYEIYKISFTGPISFISYAVLLPHPKSTHYRTDQGLFNSLYNELADSMISIRVIATVRPDAKGWAANQKFFNASAGKIANEDAEISEERKKNDAAWTEFKTMADEIKNRFNTLYESAKMNNNKFYENRDLSKQEIADATVEVVNKYYELNRYMADKRTKSAELSTKHSDYKNFFKEAVSASNKIFDMITEIKNEVKKANNENRSIYKTVITRNLYDIQLTASHIGSLSY